MVNRLKTNICAGFSYMLASVGIKHDSERMHGCLYGLIPTPHFFFALYCNTFAYGFWQKAWTPSKKVSQSFIWFAIVLAISLAGESVFGRRRAVLTTNGLIFLTASQLYSLCKTRTHANTHVPFSNPAKQPSKLKAAPWACLYANKIHM